MIRVNSIKLNSNYNSRKNISFRENNTNNITPDVAILSLQNPNALVKFEKDFKLSRSADAVQSNPVKAFAYKIYKAVKLFFKPKTDNNGYDWRNEIMQRVTLL